MRYHVKIGATGIEYSVEPMKARTTREAIAELEHLMDDCPECQAARARGEVPLAIPGPGRWQRPRWRELKRRR